MTDALDNSAVERILAFLDLATFEEGVALRAGCLVTDALTRPLEFRVSGAVRPTSLQKVLYGDTLQEYICNDLLGIPLLQSLEVKPEFVLVREAEFLKLRPRVGMPVLWARATVDGQFVLQAFPGYEKEAEAGRDALPRRLRGRNIMEPFIRIRTALDEAHNLKVGEPRKA
ncbi:MAG: hypothetical protein A2Y93_12555 [Chloroflexi bacterium RBG_13_68_17]|jgi:hypothetical protein|nr:MAG: hypothetical protein A2Y93_12555 [Chloroflexi bacterium RBG_13_68_17]